MTDQPQAPPSDQVDPAANKASATEDTPSAEPVWTYRGYHLGAGEFNTAMVHLFRAEVHRSVNWRARLDTTTNWAVITTGAAISFAFAQATSIHLVIPLDMVMVTLFLFIEARRYRYYELWSYRVRLMETDFFAAMLVPPFHPAPDWAESLAESLLHPDFPISTLEAIGRRLRRNYLWIYAIIGAAWLAKLYMLPTPTNSWADMLNRASVGNFKGQWVLLIGLIFYLTIIATAILTIGLQHSAGEVLPRYGGLAGTFSEGIAGLGKQSNSVRAWFRPSRHRQQLLTLIITDQAQKVSDRILKDMNRGVTAMAGTGMYTGQAHSVLMCALAVTEVAQLKALVKAEDPKAFVIVSPAQEVFGRGFSSLEEEK
jgi:uncharacterized membrane protein